TLVAGGRRIELSDWVTKKPDRNAVAGKLTARSLYNGQTLWQRDLPEGLEPDTPICVLDAERIYLASGDSCRALVIDAETGGDLPSITLGGDDLRVKWLGMEDGRLHALLGPPLPVRQPRSYMMAGPNRQIRMDQAAAGTTLIAWDLTAKREVWRHQEAATIDYRTVAVRGGRTYFYSERTRLACLAPDGELLWDNRDDAWLGTLKRPVRIQNGNYESTPTLIVGPSGQLRLSLPGSEDGLVFSADNGRLLWNDTVRGPKCFFVGNRYFSSQGILEASTGNPIGPSETIGSGCGIVTWAPGLDKGLGHVALGLKSPCGVGAFAAGGTLVFSPSQCDCWPHLRGAAGFSSGENVFRQARENPEHPRERGLQGEPNALASGSARTGTADQTPEASAYGSLGDWPLYRGDPKRNGLAMISAGDDARIRWTLAPDKPFPVPEGHDMHRAEWLDRPTPPVTAHGLAVYAASDGSVRAVQIDNGQPAWTFWTGGPVLTSPAIAHGRVYVGSG
ncbi:MAG: PQQ-binding-like beta-propeller repeat protein, partial [Planctomycetes bacterium]|nr:PQQ-binding-like beta-propeller repeat protein [Planctomycetota bacterium]